MKETLTALISPECISPATSAGSTAARSQLGFLRM